jgi:uncharacterized protein YjiS (DUF1127 family)
MQTLSMKDPATLPGTIWRAIRRLASDSSSALQQRRVLHDLSTLEDHLLADIGIERSEIEHLVGLGKQARRKANII